MDTREVPDGMDPAEHLARSFHEAYERLAPKFGYETRKKSAVPWEEVPEDNRQLMIATAQSLIDNGVVRLLPPGSASPHGRLDWGDIDSVREVAERLADSINEKDKAARGIHNEESD